MVIDSIGAVCFGLIIGWVTYRTLRRTGETVALSNIASVVGALGGAAVTGLFKGQLFGWTPSGCWSASSAILTRVAVLLNGDTAGHQIYVRSRTAGQAEPTASAVDLPPAIGVHVRNLRRVLASEPIAPTTTACSKAQLITSRWADLTLTPGP